MEIDVIYDWIGAIAADENSKDTINMYEVDVSISCFAACRFGRLIGEP